MGDYARKQIVMRRKTRVLLGGGAEDAGAEGMGVELPPPDKLGEGQEGPVTSTLTRDRHL